MATGRITRQVVQYISDDGKDLLKQMNFVKRFKKVR